MDSTDLYLLKVLQENARVSYADLARELNMAPSAMLERVRKLEQRGLIVGYEARLAAGLLGLGLTAFIFVRAEERPFTGKVSRSLAAIPEVQEVHCIAGDDCYLVKLRAKDTAHLNQLLHEAIGSIRGVTSTRTTIVLETIKESATFPLEHLTNQTA